MSEACFWVEYCTDVGIKKKTNQDSLMIKVTEYEDGEVLLAAVCDGMGGLDKGELASATLIRALETWFSNNYLEQEKPFHKQEVCDEWKQLFEETNQKLMRYGEENGVQLGTTVTVALVFSNGQYLIGHVGDTRAYRIGSQMLQLTEDHTLIAREMKRGNLTPEQAAVDTRRNVLLQCIGVNEYIEPQFVDGNLQKEEEILLCSDGFRHAVTSEEIFRMLQTGEMSGENRMKWALQELVEENKRRNETDNISAILIKKIV